MSNYTRALLVSASLLLAVGCAGTSDGRNSNVRNTSATNTSTPATQPTYEQSEIVDAAADFFGITADAAGQAIERVFRENGRPTGYIRGEEISGAIGVGLRIGEGDLRLKNGQVRKVFWQGPSIGFDTGANASKVFTLVYGLSDSDQIYQRFPGVSGSAYLVGGVGVSYARANDITLAPMRSGVGLRLGANVGYQSYSRERQALPF
ncbi:MAG: DUF1134 domain-containing protein [Alphaproteobacteria bacterium]|nr:DUF1134 domain-containing protein [Alphaproteobacteria bacterium]MDZ4777416.1 DUF1134 domain-containing protein [Alphaproteobacteria bacterium]